MEEKNINPLASPYIAVDSNHYQGDEPSGYEDSVYDVSKSRGHVLQQQWVTLTASMYPEPTLSTRPGWKIAPERLPILAAVFCGAALVVCLLAAFLLYRCCIMPRREKHYFIRKTETVPNEAINCRTGPPTSTTQPNYPAATPSVSQAIVFAEQKNYGVWGYGNNRLVPNPWYNNRVAGPQCTQCPGICPVPRSNSNPGTSSQCRTDSKRQRPLSQPVHLLGPSIITNGEIVPKSGLPEISEFNPQQSGQYASSSILDEAGSKDENSDQEPTLKTRSLPAWVRSKPRPLSTEDDLNDLYAKVNFSKKRKNRMRNDEAAIIALSKSRSQFLHKDTDCLVDNEAVIVYDERTAL